MRSADPPEPITDRPTGRYPLAVRIAAVVAVVLAAFLLPALRDAKARTQLIAPIGPDVQTAAIFLGCFVGLLIAGRMVARWRAGESARSGRAPPSGVRLAASLLIVVVTCVTAATWAVRSLVEWRAFAGLSPPGVPEPFVVVGTESGSRGAAYYLRLRQIGEERVFALSVPRSVYEAAEPGETVTLPVQTGRGGVRRMVAPERPLTTSDLHHG